MMSYGETAVHCVCPLCGLDYLKTDWIGHSVMSSLAHTHSFIHISMWQSLELRPKSPFIVAKVKVSFTREFDTHFHAVHISKRRLELRAKGNGGINLAVYPGFPQRLRAVHKHNYWGSINRWWFRYGQWWVFHIQRWWIVIGALRPSQCTTT